MNLSPDLEGVADALCARFEQGDYGPTPIIDLGVLVACADGRIDDDEREVLRDIVRAMLGERLSPELVGYLIQASLEVIEEAGAEARALLIAEILLDCDAAEEGVLVALSVAFASEGLSAKERAIIATLARAAGLGEQRLEALIARARPGPASVA